MAVTRLTQGEMIGPSAADRVAGNEKNAREDRESRPLLPVGRLHPRVVSDLVQKVISIWPDIGTCGMCSNITRALSYVSRLTEIGESANPRERREPVEARKTDLASLDDTMGMSEAGVAFSLSRASKG